MQMQGTRGVFALRALVNNYYYVKLMYSTDHKQLNIYSHVLAKSSRVRVEYLQEHAHCPRVEVLYLLVRTRELRVARTCEHCKQKYYTHTYGSRMRAHSYGTHTRVRTRSLLASAALTSREHSLHPRELSVGEC